MPRSNDPGTIRVGSGKAPVQENADLDLTGSGMVGAGPNVGQVAGEVPLIVGGPDPNPPVCVIGGGGGGAAPPPPTTGNFSLQTTFTGIPDWGVLKLADASLADRGIISSAQAGGEIFPYYQGPPSPAIDNPPFSDPGPGSDPETDPRWNSAISGEVMSVRTLKDAPAGVLDGVYWIFYAAPTDAYYVWYTNGTAVDPTPVPPVGVTYTGIQVTFVNSDGADVIATLTKAAIDGASITGGNPTVVEDGNELILTNALQGDVPDVADGAVPSGFTLATELQGFTGSGVGATFSGGITRVDPTFGPVIRTDRLMARTGSQQRVILSGSIYPADRGVLALIHWPAGGTTTEFIAQPLLDRCVAGLVLGQGLHGATPEAPDGAPGGIFGIGEDANGDHDPFMYPGQATGQYNLDEIVLGQSAIDSAVLNPPWDDWDGDTVQGAQRVQNSNVPGPGQVRLGSDPSAGEPASPYGIPVLGAGTNMYAPPAGALLGNTAVIDENFFGYRVPYLDDYSSPTGLKYTPRGVDATATRETNRYFFQETPNQDSPSVVLLTNAGDFSPFVSDNINWQIARYRHAFVLPNTAPLGDPEDAGSYFLVHFQTETNFEDFVRDGILPDDPTNGYETYSARLDSSALSLEGTLNVVNEFVGTATPPEGPAPDYGYDAVGYHTARTSVFLDPDGDTVDASGITATYNWDSDSTGGAEMVMWVSGVAYFSPIDPGPGASAFRFTGLSVNLPPGTPGFWEDSFRVDSRDLSGPSIDTAPANLASPNPAFVTVTPFSYNLTQGGGAAPTYTLPATNTDPNLEFAGRWEYPYEFLGSNGNGVFSPTNGPRPADDLDIALVGGDLDFDGDGQEPAFTTDAKVRVYFRKPTAHTTADGTVQPFSEADGHGVALAPNPAGPIMFHSSLFSIGGFVKRWPVYGNFKKNLSVGVSTFQSTATKDVQERFLDESYRWVSTWANDLVANGVRSHLSGPGMHGTVHASTTVQILNTGAGDTITIGGVLFTAVNGGAVAANQQFNDVPFTGSNAITLQSLEATVLDLASIALMVGLNAGESVVLIITNPGVDTTATLTSKNPGVVGELLLATNNAATILLGFSKLVYAPHLAAPIVVPLVSGGAEAPWKTSSYVKDNFNRTSLVTLTNELQVAGLPDRNPPISEGNKAPFPSRGLLMYPQKDYLTPFTRPSVTGGDLATVQPDYSAETGVRSHVRTFDIGFKRFSSSFTPVDAEGQPFFHIRVDGLSFGDFTYTAPGPGGLAGASGISIMAKVPGLTTWMDLGRVDGSGPSKQDIATDGAGCQVVGAETFESVDPETGIVFCQIKVNVGPTANLFFANAVSHEFNNGAVSDVTEEYDYVPVLIKVVMDVAGAAYNLEEEYTGVAGGFNPGAKPGLSWGDTRGLVGIEIVHPDDVTS